jgi:hypothetical protein
MHFAPRVTWSDIVAAGGPLGSPVLARCYLGLRPMFRLTDCSCAWLCAIPLL